MDLPSDIKHLFLNWFQEEYERHVKIGSKLSLTYNRAIQSLRACPITIKHPDQLVSLKYIGEKMVKTMSSKLKKYCDENGYEYPGSDLAPVPSPKKKKKTDSTVLDTADDEIQPKKKRTKSVASNDNDDLDQPKQKRTKRYIPNKNTGGYAILLALISCDADCSGMTKEDIIQAGTQYCSSSFLSNPSTGQFYSAWASIKSLEKHEYVKSKGRPVHYYLTEAGEEIAKTLKKVHDSSLDLPSITTLPTLKTTEDDFQQRPQEPFVVTEPQPESTKSIHEGTYYTTWEPGSFDIIFVIDTREIRSTEQRDFFSKQLKALNVDNFVKSLAVGDGTWIARHKITKVECILDFILERKRLDDFASSITDGRFTEQKARLKRTGMGMIFYIVEEQMASDVSRFSEAIQTCMSMSVTNSGFHVKRTKDSDDTVQLLSRLTNMIKLKYENKSLMVLDPNNMKSQYDYSHVLNRFRSEFQDANTEIVYRFNTFQSMLSKSNLVTVREMFVRMLMTIKGVSFDKAIVMQQHYKTPKGLIQAFKDYKGDKPKMVSETFKDQVGNKKIGRAISSKVYELWGMSTYS